MTSRRMGSPTEGLHEPTEAQRIIRTIGKLTPATKSRVMGRVADLANGQPISEWDPDRLQQLAAYLREIDPSREAGALQLAELKLTEVQQVTAAAIAEYVGITWPVDEAFADEYTRGDRASILEAVAEHHDRLAKVWADLDRDEAKMRAAVTTALASDGGTISDVLGSLTIDTAADTTADNDDEVNWEAIASQQLADLIRLHGEVISKAGVIDREMSKLSDAIQDAITTVESMFPSEGDTTNE